MRLDGEKEIGCLNKIGLPHPLDFTGHFFLLGIITHMFDDRVGKDDVKFLIRELRHVRSISGHAGKVGRVHRVGFQIEQDNMNAIQLVNSHAFPEGDGSAHVQYFQGSRKLIQPLFKYFKSSGSQPPGQAVCTI